MRDYLKTNIREIKKHLKIRTKKLSNLNNLSLMDEFKEWNDINIDEKLIWTLPDLTRDERLKNFCRSIKKKIY